MVEINRLFDLSGRVAALTGGASGIGRATAVVLASAGANVVLGDVDELGMDETARFIEDTGGKAVTIRTDARAIFICSCFSSCSLSSRSSTPRPRSSVRRSCARDCRSDPALAFLRRKGNPGRGPKECSERTSPPSFAISPMNEAAAD